MFVVTKSNCLLAQHGIGNDRVQNTKRCGQGAGDSSSRLPVKGSGDPFAAESRFVGRSQFLFDLGGGTAEVLAGCAADGVGSMLADFRRLQSCHGERSRW